jgi:hypothetical protein
MQLRKLVTLVIATGLFLPAVQAQQWENLFNGKDLSGFRILNGKASYVVQNGEIIGTTVANSPNSFLATEKTYGDFILEVDFKVNDQMNSGIQFRSEIKDANDKCNVTDKRTPERVHGYQVEIDPSDRGWSGGIYDEARRGWLYSMDNNPAAKNAFKHNDWNHYRVEAIGNSIRTWVNGIACAHLIDDMTPRGFIALQVHAVNDPKNVGEEIRWKNVRIQTKNLKPSPDDDVFVVNTLPNNLSNDEARLGVKLLWDGSTTNGWRAAGQDVFPDKAWYIRDGALHVTREAGGRDIVSTTNYAAFDLQFEFQLSDTANSGVKYFVMEKEPTTNSPIGFEYQVLDDDKHPDAKAGVGGDRTLASLYDLIAATKNGREKVPIGEWNRGRIVAYPDGHITHWLNGWKVLDYNRNTPEFAERVARSKYAKIPGFATTVSGPILLQYHQSHVAFRSIKIKELK